MRGSSYRSQEQQACRVLHAQADQISFRPATGMEVLAGTSVWADASGWAKWQAAPSRRRSATCTGAAVGTATVPSYSPQLAAAPAAHGPRLQGPPGLQLLGLSPPSPSPLPFTAAPAQNPAIELDARMHPWQHSSALPVLLRGRPWQGVSFPAREYVVNPLECREHNDRCKVSIDQQPPGSAMSARHRRCAHSLQLHSLTGAAGSQSS